MSNGDIYYHDNMQWRQYTHLEIYYTDTFTYYGTTSEDYQTVTRPWKSITTGGTTSWQQISWGS